MRRTYQSGWLERKTLKGVPDAWVYRYREQQPDGTTKKRSRIVGTVEKYPNEGAAWKAAENLKLIANPDNPQRYPVTFGAVLERYMAEELPELRHSTGQSCRSYIRNYLTPKWGIYPIGDIRSLAVEQWLKSLKLAGKSKGHIRNIMRVVFNCAQRWELLPMGENPMKKVRVRGVSKRSTDPRIITMPEFNRLLEEIGEEPFRTMILVDMATGLRCSELLALKWEDFNWDELTVQVRRGVVDGVVDDVKTKYSRVSVPLDPRLVEILLDLKRHSHFNAEEDWVFASPAQNGRMPYRPWGVQQRRIRPAARRAGLGDIGWHNLRHTFSSLLRANGEDIKVQQELLRHADVRTTMNVYTQADSDQKRQAHSRVVRMMLPAKVAV